MSFEHTERLWNAVKQARDRIEAAERKFQIEKNRLERASRAITLKPDNLSTAIDIISKVEIATDELYSTYEAVICFLDVECRPCLEHEVDAEAIKNVVDLMKQINESSSDLGSSAEISINGRSFGDFTTTQYIASIGAKAIEMFWITKYNATPEAQEENRRKIEAWDKKRKKRAEKANQANATKDSTATRKAEREAAEAERVAELNAKAKVHMDEVGAECDRKAVEFEYALNEFIQNRMNLYQSQVNQKINELRSNIEELGKRKSRLSIFKSAEKNKIKQEISVLQFALSKYQDPNILHSEYYAMKQAADKALNDYKNRLDFYMSKRFTDYKPTKRKRSKTAILYVENATWVEKGIPEFPSFDDIFAN